MRFLSLNRHAKSPRICLRHKANGGDHRIIVHNLYKILMQQKKERGNFCVYLRRLRANAAAMTIMITTMAAMPTYRATGIDDDGGVGAGEMAGVGVGKIVGGAVGVAVTTEVGGGAVGVTTADGALAIPTDDSAEDE